ncbi:hypothetical protein CEXT_365531 [Caerostris extrusa]|uniref:Uncharacterized protein n=1 Tax=Caerostris extrusa TaxID=172846 RepID=A0AAV4UZA5_CAEEX|nr:hypothetical protein CEXT_365531 [Caerostris extrusa]
MFEESPPPLFKPSLSPFPEIHESSPTLWCLPSQPRTNMPYFELLLDSANWTIFIRHELLPSSIICFWPILFFSVSVVYTQSDFSALPVHTAVHKLGLSSK